MRVRLASLISPRRSLGVLGVALVVALVVVVVRQPAVPVSVHVVSAEPFVESVSEQGRTRLRERFTLSAPIDGYLRRVAVEPGDPVVSGQPLAAIEPLPAPALDARARRQAESTLDAAQARYEAAQADRDNLRSDLQLAESELRRQQALHAQQLISDADMDRLTSQRERARSALRAAEASVAARRSERDSAQLMLDVAEGVRDPDARRSVALTSPINGQVLQRHRCCEGPVRAGDAVLELGNLDDLEVHVDVLSADAVRIRPGMRVLIDGWGGEQTLEGRVRLIEPAGQTRVSALGVEEQRVAVAIALRSPREDRDGLGDGFRVDVRIVLWEGEAVLQVPGSALFRRDDAWSVLVVEDGRAKHRLVTPGRRSGLRTQIVDGLTAGEQVITHPDSRLQSGDRVRFDGMLNAL